ncbi:formin-binding protein 4-like [Colias croceus]|uniref:formin-binding protein 4-like n=1 Tax=Colias crocea TaxID=72248 RepID=UPI001E27CDBC|nr:formin-binding protein 4-like [Colias croceus]
MQQKWEELIDMLNSDGTGDSRTEEKWRKVVGGEDVSLSGVQVPATETVDELTVDDAAYEYTPIPEDESNTPGTSSQPTVAPPLSPPTPPPALTPPPGPVQTQWQPPKKKKKPEDLVIKVFKECETNAREYEKERDRIAQELERERIRQRDVELQLQAQWLDFLREALKVLNSYLEKRSE